MSPIAWLPVKAMAIIRSYDAPVSCHEQWWFGLFCFVVSKSVESGNSQNKGIQKISQRDTNYANDLGKSGNM